MRGMVRTGSWQGNDDFSIQEGAGPEPAVPEHEGAMQLSRALGVSLHVARPMSCVPRYCKVIDQHTEGSQMMPKSDIKLV